LLMACVRVNPCVGDGHILVAFARKGAGFDMVVCLINDFYCAFCVRRFLFFKRKTAYEIVM